MSFKPLMVGLVLWLSACSASGNVAIKPVTGSSSAPAGSNDLATANPLEVCTLYFGQYDANHDGSASLQEFEAAKLIPAGYGTIPSPIVTTSADGQTSSATVVPPSKDQLDASFQLLDANHDGKLTQDELCAAIVAKTPSASPSAAATSGPVSQ